jgi:tRNA-specific 2-thiouridylase
MGIAYPEPLYVLRIEKNGDVIVGGASETLQYSFCVRDVVWQGLDPASLHVPEEPSKSLCEKREMDATAQQNLAFPCLVQIRYRSAPIPARIIPYSQGCVLVEVEGGARSITPGQRAVFFDTSAQTGELYILGGGTIVS